MAKTGRRGGKLQAGGVLQGVSAEQHSAAQEPCQRKTNSKESYQVKGWAQIYCNYRYVCAISAFPHAQVVSTLPSPHFKSHAAKWWVTNHCKGMRQAGMDGWMDGDNTTHFTACGESDLTSFAVGSCFQKRFLVTLLFLPTTSPVQEGM